jgi:hypothetical protein
VHEYFRAIICPQANPVGLLGGSYNAPMADGDVGHVAEPSASRKRGGEVGGGDKEPEVAGCEYGQSPDDPPNCVRHSSVDESVVILVKVHVLTVYTAIVLYYVLFVHSRLSTVYKVSSLVFTLALTYSSEVKNVE